VRPAGVIKAGDGPEAIAVDTQNGTAWIADNEGDSVTEIAGGKVRATIPLGSVSPLDIAVDSRTGTVWVADGSSGSVTEISAKTGHVLATVALSQTSAVVNSIAVDPAHGQVFVTEINLGNLVEFSESHPASQHVVAGGNTPVAVAADSAARTAWVSDEAGTVTEVSYRGTLPTVLHTLDVSGGPGAIAADATAGLIFVAEYSANAVEIINATSRKVRTVKVGKAPGSLAADPLHGDVWVANTNSHSLSQIQESAHKVTATYPTGFSPAEVAVQPEQACTPPTSRPTRSRSCPLACGCAHHARRPSGSAGTARSWSPRPDSRRPRSACRAGCQPGCAGRTPARPATSPAPRSAAARAFTASPSGPPRAGDGT
jgi:DNA-binding beta-propeller fold protein YncE